MLTVYVPQAGHLVPHQLENPKMPIPPEAVWIDMVRPTTEEEACVSAFLNAELPSQEERVEIETSSRLYEEDNALVMSASILFGAYEGQPKTTVVTFVLVGNRLASVRHAEPVSFSIAQQRCTKAGVETGDGKAMLVLLLDAIIDRLADILELANGEIEKLSVSVFEKEKPGEAIRDYAEIIRALGLLGAEMSRIHESVVSLSRLLQFLTAREKKVNLNVDERVMVKSLARDIRSLNEFAASLDNKVTFLLDATLGLVNLQQSQTTKIFSVLAVIFLPPTLIASVYGMNFDLMPELHTPFGYPLAIGGMVLSAVLSWAFFRWKRWL